MRTGKARGLSIEFHAFDETRSGGLRLVQDALLSGIGIVRSPSYELSRVEARGRRGTTLRARIPTGKRLGCACSGAECKFARLMREGVKKAFDDAFRKYSQVVAAYNRYDRPLGSVSKGNVRGRVLADGDGEVEVDLPVGEDGDAVIRALEDSGVVIRPFVEDLDDVPVIEGRAADDGTRVYNNFAIRAFIVSSTDQREGWPEPELIATPADLPDIDVVVPTQRRRRFWL